MRNEYLPRDPEAADAIFHASDAGVEVQLAAVGFRRCAVVTEIEQQVGKVFVRSASAHPRYSVCGGLWSAGRAPSDGPARALRPAPASSKRIGFRELAVEQQLADLPDLLERLRIVVLDVAAGPHAVLVELDALVVHAARS